MKIDGNENFIIPFQNEKGEDCTMLILQPAKVEIDKISFFLSYLYTKTQSQISPDIIVRDYERFLDECLALNPMYNRQSVDYFIERAFLTAEIVTAKNEIVNYNNTFEFSEGKDGSKQKNYKYDFNDESFEIAKGMFFFLLALMRYSTPQSRMSLKRDFITSLNVTEWVNSHKKSSTEPKAKKRKDYQVNIQNLN